MAILLTSPKPCLLGVYLNFQPCLLAIAFPIDGYKKPGCIPGIKCNYTKQLPEFLLFSRPPFFFFPHNMSTMITLENLRSFRKHTGDNKIYNCIKCTLLNALHSLCPKGFAKKQNNVNMCMFGRSCDYNQQSSTHNLWTLQLVLCHTSAQNPPTLV